MEQIEVDEIVIKGVTYVPKNSQPTLAEENGMPFVIVRGDRSGVFFGYLMSRNGKELILCNARCAWYWSGASTLLQMANDGVKRPNDCKFTQEVQELHILDVIEIVQCTEAAKINLKSVKVWQQ